MRVTFVGLGWEQLGLGLLAAIARERGDRVGLAFSVALFRDRYNLNVPWLAPLFDDRKDVLAAIQKQRPDVLVFSPLTGTYQWMLGIAAQAKELFPSVKVVFGGAHTSAVPEMVIAQPQVDYVCVGEGDEAFVKILEAVEQGDTHSLIPNTRYKLSDGQIRQGPQTGFIQNLDALPAFDKRLWEGHINIGDWYLTMASRGCPYRCTFCFNNYYARLPTEKSGSYVRQRSVGHVMAELNSAKKRYKLRFLEFEDDVFTVNKGWVKDFLIRYKREIALPFQCLTHPRYMDEDIARWLSDAGCQYVQMGIQSADEAYKYQVIKRYESNEQVEKALDWMLKYRLRPKVDHMFGLPGEPLQAQESARRIYTRYPPYRIQTFWTNFLPGTQMTAQAHKDGVLSEEQLSRIQQGLDFDFYRESSKVTDPVQVKTYKAYEVFFKMIPVLPGVIRSRLRPEVFQYFPSGLLSFLSFLCDALAGLIKKNPDHLIYARHYLRHMRRLLLKKIGFPWGPTFKERYGVDPGKALAG